jgi:hypothetical protein
VSETAERKTREATQYENERNQLTRQVLALGDNKRELEGKLKIKIKELADKEQEKNNRIEEKSRELDREILKNVDLRKQREE